MNINQLEFSINITLENLRHENGLEKDQIDQLLLKLKEKENIQFDLETEINDLTEVFSVLNKKLKVSIQVTNLI